MRLIVPFRLAFSRARVTKALCKGVMIDLELRDFLVLIGSDGNELGFFENVSSKRRHRNFLDIVTADQVKSWLVLVHGVQHSLKVGYSNGSIDW